MSNDNGGSAFPYGIKEIRVDAYSVGVTEVSDDFDSGMTLRDYFAAKAMQAILTLVLTNAKSDIDNIAPSAYEVADAMLKERNK